MRTVFGVEAFSEACDRPIIRSLRFLTCATSTVYALTLPLVQNALVALRALAAEALMWRCVPSCVKFEFTLSLPVAPSVTVIETLHHADPRGQNKSPDASPEFTWWIHCSLPFGTLLSFPIMDPPPVLHADLSTNTVSPTDPTT
jgi:hypothetical protein